MKLAFCLFKYFPYGGLQRDFLRIATICQNQGHEVHVFTASWEGEEVPGFIVHKIAVRGLQNHTRNNYFAKQVKHAIDKEHYDLVVGFNKMPHLDLYYAADVCYQARARKRHNLLYRLLPRYLQQVKFEKSVFNKNSRTEIMLIAPREQAVFAKYYQTPSARFHMLPPGISKDRMAPANASQIRQKIRSTQGVKDNDFILLMVGSGFKTKGVDRSLKALAALPLSIKQRCQLWIIGQDNPHYFLKLAESLNITKQIHFLGGRDDVADFYLAADVLLHPAYHENTGTVLLEAIIAGLPVLTSDVCGYSPYVLEAEAGLVMPSPFSQIQFNESLVHMLISSQLAEWSANGIAFGKGADIYSMPERAAAIIERMGQKRVS